MTQIPLGRWGNSDDRPSPRQAALIAEVLQAFAAAGGEAAAAASEGADDGAPKESHGFSVGVENLIAAAVSEVSRANPAPPFPGGIAPVLGAGVVHGLLRHRREHPEEQLPESSIHVDERL